MPAKSRFDIAALRTLGQQRKSASTAWLDELQISRRRFLGFSAAAGAGAAIHPFLLGEGFSTVYDGSKIDVLVHDEARWTIDATKFGPSAKVSILKAGGRAKLNLTDAVFPGTKIPANFEALLVKRAGTWMMEMDMTCGIRVEAGLLAWLDSQVPAQGQWRAGVLRPCEGFRMIFRGVSEVRFTRDWVFEVAGPATATVDGLSQNLGTDWLRMELNPKSQIANGLLAHKTLFQLQRGSQSWRVNLQRESEQGWSLAHDEQQELFDEFHVEAGETHSGALHSGLLLQREDNSAPVHLLTGGGLTSDSGDPFHLSLHNPRLAFALNESPVRSALVAELSTQPTWAHGEHASYYIAGTPVAPHVELIDDGDQSAPPDLAPGLCQVCFPDDAVAMNLKFDLPKPFRLTWADLAAPFERFWGILHLLPSQHSLDIEFDDNPKPDHTLQIDRPRDMLSLRFQFKNMRLKTGCNPRIVLRDKNNVGYVSVIFPPQHVAEEAAFHADDNAGIYVDVPIGAQEVLDRGWAASPPTVTLCDIESAKQKLDPDYLKPSPAGCPPNRNSVDPNTNKDPQRPRTLVAGDSRIVLEIPKGETEIPFHLESLLDWKNWSPVVADVAKHDIKPLPPPEIPITRPDSVTSIELPYRLVLSPSDLGRWFHPLLPAQQGVEAVELWHTRLTLPLPPTNGQSPSGLAARIAPPTVRAIWSPDYSPLTPGCAGNPTDKGLPNHYPDPLHNPPADPLYFRMSLDERDRCELVHLTSNYRIQTRESFCSDTPVLKDLLAPAPITVENLILTSMGGYLKSLGVWDPVKINNQTQLTVQQWRHIATLGRDHYARVVYKGYLLPFGHPASLIKVTERKIVVNKDFPQNGFVAILHQRMFIVVQHPVKDFPVFGQPNGGRQIPFKQIEVLTLITPDIDAPQGLFPPSSTAPNRSQSQSLFWPMVGGQAFPFRFRFTDLAGNISEASLPVVFADAAVSQNSLGYSTASPRYGAEDARDLYNFGSRAAGASPDGSDDARTTARFSNQKVAFAAPTKPGDTQYDADVIAFNVVAPPAAQDVLDLYKRDLPYFYPSMPYARVSSSSIKRVTGNTDSTRVVFFKNYISSGFDPQQNRGEVFLQVHDDKTLKLVFGSTASVDKAGGLASPDTVIAGFSRKAGAVGGKPPVVAPNTPAPSNPDPTPSLTTYSAGNFNPSGFFGGLTSAKILGAIQLSDVIAPLAPGLASNLEKAPQMIEQALFEIESVIVSIFSAISAVQSFVPKDDSGNTYPNPIAQHLAPQGQQVSALNDARVLAQARTRAAPANSLAALADAVAEGDLDRQLVGAIKDYATALEDVLSNPVALVEEALVERLTGWLWAAFSPTDLENRFATFITDLQHDLNSAVSGAQKTSLSLASEALQALADAALPVLADEPPKQLLLDTLRIARDQLNDADAAKALLPFTQYAPDLMAVCDLINTAQDLQSRVNKLVNKPGLAMIPSFFEQLGGILDDLSQIYQSAGFLGVVSANQNVVDEIIAAVAAIAGVWQQVDYISKLVTNATGTTDKKVQALEDTCLKLAAQAKTDSAKKVLQNLRQVQRALDSIAGYKVQIGQWSGTGAALAAKDARRLTQLVQQLQRQILSSLSAMQAMIHSTEKELDAAATASGVALSAFEAQITELASLLTAADALIGTAASPPPIETTIFASLAKPVGNLLAGPIAAKTMALQAQLAGVRTSLANDAIPNNLSLKLLHYDLSLQLQSSFAAGLQWSIFDVTNVVSPALKIALDQFSKFNTLAQAVRTNIVAAIASALCPLTTLWNRFLLDLQSTTGTDHALKLPVYNLFKTSLDGIATALNQLCVDLSAPAPLPLPIPVPQPAAVLGPSVILADTRNTFTAFKVLFDDVHARITGLSALPKLLLDQAVAIGKQQLETLLQQIPVPKSVTLSYDWHPAIQPFEPVFFLNEGADFIVSARAQLSLPGGPPPSVNIEATLTNFSINLIGSPSFIIVGFNSLNFTSHNGSSPDCRVKIKNVEFGEDMSFVKSLAEALNPSKGPFIELTDGAIKAGYRFSLDKLLSSSDPGGMTVMGLNIEVAVALPFNGDPVRAEFGIADQQHPFLLAFGIYGGGGFLQLQLGLDGVQLLQGALEFGLVSSITIGPLQGDGFVVAGIYFRIAGSNSSVCGFVHAHGHMDIFGLISLDVDLYVSICYDSGVVRGTATFSVQVSILFFSESFSLQASYSFGSPNGGGSAAMFDPFTAAPWHDREELSAVAFFVSPDNPQSTSKTSAPEPVFIEDADWEAYMNAFDI